MTSIVRCTPFAFLLLTPGVRAQSLSVPGHTVEVYASVTDPMRLAFDAAGVLYVGRDDTGSGGGAGTAVKIHRVEIGGAPVSEYGASAIGDPDAVIVDTIGELGAAGSVITGGQISTGIGHITEVAPDESVTTLFGPSGVIRNPNDFLFEPGGRLLIADAGSSATGIYQVVNGVLSQLVPTALQLGRMELDSTGRIFVISTGGIISIYDPTGAPVDPSFAINVSGVLTIGSMNGFPESVYTLSPSQELLRIDMQGNVSVIGDPYAGNITDLRFGPDGALYVSDFGNDQVLRITEGPVSYCTAGFSASGCQAALSWTGTASASASSGFAVSAASVEGSKDGLFFFGTNGRQANSWGNGSSFQCVQPPVSRAGLLVGSGSTGTCDGAFSQDLNALWCAGCPKPQKNPGAGAAVRLQLWHRDPLNTSNQTTTLSNALEFVVGP